MKKNCYHLIAIISFLLFFQGCSKNKIPKYLSFHPIEFKFIKSEPLSDEDIEQFKRKVSDIENSIVCGQVITFKIIETHQTSPNMPKSLNDKMGITIRDIPLSEAINILNKKCKIKIRLLKDIQYTNSFNINLESTSFYMVFHQISFWNSIGWGVKNNVVYFGRNLKDMDFIGAQYSDLNKVN